METKTTVQFYDPLLVYTNTNECDDVHEMLAQWKAKYLTGKHIEMWNYLKEPKSRLPNIIKWLIFIPRYLWPLIVLSVAGAYLPFTSVCFASVVLLLVQTIILVSFAAKTWDATCVAAAFELEKRHGNKPE